MDLTYKRFLRSTLKLAFVLLFLGCIFVIYFYGVHGEFFWVIPIMGFCLYGFFHVHTLKIHLSDTGIVWKDFLISREINFIDVTEISYYNKRFEIRTSKRKILIGNDIENQKKAIRYIYSNLKQINRTYSVGIIKDSYNIF